MRPDEIEYQLAALSVVSPNPARERALLERLHDAEEAAATHGPSQPCPWWRRPIPLWQAAAAVVAVVIVDLTWLRPPVRASDPEPALAVRIEGDVFADRRRSGEPMDISRWETRVSASH